MYKRDCELILLPLDIGTVFIQKKKNEMFNQIEIIAIVVFVLLFSQQQIEKHQSDSIRYTGLFSLVYYFEQSKQNQFYSA